MKRWILPLILLIAAAAPSVALAGGTAATPEPHLLGIRLEFLLFGLTLIGVAVFYRHTFSVAATGLAALIALKLGFTDFDMLHHLYGFQKPRQLKSEE